MNKVFEGMLGDTVEYGTIDVSVHTLRGSQLAELTVKQAHALIKQLEAAIAAVEAHQ